MTSSFIRSLCLLAAFLLLERSAVLFQDHSAPVAEIRTLYSKEFGIAHPAGLSYSVDLGQLFVLEKNHRDHPVTAGSTVAILTPYEELVDRVDLDFVVDDTLSTVLDDRGKRLLLLHGEPAELIQISVGDNGIVDPSRRASFDVRQFGLSRAQGMAVDPDRRFLFVLDSVARQVVRVTLNTDRFDGAITRLNLARLGMTDARGIAVNPADGHVYVMSPAEQRLYELTQEGQPVATYDLKGLNLIDPRGLVIAPSADLTDSPAVMHLYIADSGLPDRQPALAGIAPEALVEQQPGKIVEVALGADAQSVAPSTTSTSLILVWTVDMAAFSPPSPDPSGLTYLSASNTLLVSDAEVEETVDGVIHFQGANLWELTLDGAVVRTANISKVAPTVVPMTNEPTGVAWDPASGDFFFSDDGTRRVYRLNPGADG
ncbi:MAG: hypothetical protein M5U01_32030 [Ardenticatenaceae bacterium]|nr:hypothetical protein [Ardenticatenaceae bacterium]